MIIKTAIPKSFLLGVLLTCSMFAQAGFAQNGSINGNLLDPNGTIVTGLNSPITLVNIETGGEYSAAVSREGRYSVSALPPGSYNLNFPISCCMYRTYAQELIEIMPGQTVNLDLNLEWGINLGTIGDDPGMLAEDMITQAGEISGAPPRMPDGKPDFSGIWYNVPNRERNEPIPQQPWAQDIAEQLRALGQQGSASYCLPQSAVLSTLIFPYKLVQKDDVIVQIIEFVTPGFRQIFLDGRDIPEIWNPSWYGHSVGHWEGDTLVVESKGFNEVTPGFGVHTENLRIIERYTRPEIGRLLVEITAEDPEAYTESYTRSYEARLVPQQEILEFVCAEGNDTSLFAQPVWRGRP